LSHHCHWPGCDKEVPPKMWGCKTHWYMLPKSIRDKIWATYRPGQEITKDPSDEYMAAAAEARIFCLRYNAVKAEIKGGKPGLSQENIITHLFKDLEVEDV
jgi:hypothetical protein